MKGEGQAPPRGHAPTRTTTEKRGCSADWLFFFFFLLSEVLHLREDLILHIESPSSSNSRYASQPSLVVIVEEHQEELRSRAREMERENENNTKADAAIRAAFHRQYRERERDRERERECTHNYAHAHRRRKHHHAKALHRKYSGGGCFARCPRTSAVAAVK